MARTRDKYSESWSEWHVACPTCKSKPMMRCRLISNPDIYAVIPHVKRVRAFVKFDKERKESAKERYEILQADRDSLIGWLENK